MCKLHLLCVRLKSEVTMSKKISKKLVSTHSSSGTAQTRTTLTGIHAVRVSNLRNLVQAAGGMAALARRLNFANGSYLRQICGDNPIRPFTEKSARSMEVKLSLAPGWFDVRNSISTSAATLDGSKLGSSHWGESAKWSISVLKSCADLLCELKLTLSQDKFSEFVELALMSAADNSGEFNAAYMRRVAKLLK